jgi:transporter family protein
MSWLGLAILTAACFGAYNVLIKVASSRIDLILGAVVLQVVATLAGGAMLAVQKLRGVELTVTGSGVGYAALAGLAVGAAEILTFLVFARGAPASLGTPVIMGGSILCGAALGIALLGEKITMPQAAGAILIVAGVALLSSGSAHAGT